MKPTDLTAIVARIHAQERPLAVAITGGGSGAISALLRMPGGSRTLLEAIVPYSDEALCRWLGSRPEQFCAPRTGRSMAVAAYEHARRLVASRPEVPEVLGVGCTASLASDRPKRGAHRAHVAWQNRRSTVAIEVVLRKGERTRAEEEDLLTRLVLLAIDEGAAETARLPRFPPCDDPWRFAGQLPAADGALIRGEQDRFRGELRLLDDEPLSLTRQDAPLAWQALRLGQCLATGRGPRADCPNDGRPRTVFPGAFNPRHSGHQAIADLAGQRLGRPVEFEVSITNVDKPPLDYIEMAGRNAEFEPDETLWFTSAPTFVEKAKCFPGSTFVVGADTLVRIADERYYASHAAGGDTGRRDQAIAQIAAQGCRFLVFGRRIGSEFRSLESIDIPAALRELCTGVGEAEFRADISSTELRAQAEP